MDSEPTQENSPDAPPPERRDFFRRMMAIVIGPILGLVPAVTGAVAFLDPTRSRKGASDAGPPFIRVTSLSAVPPDGKPRLFRVVYDRHRDAWTTRLNVPVGAVYLTRRAESPEEIQALNTVCPHLGCFVETKTETTFLCPCHNSEFLADGSKGEPCVAARGMDTLPTRIEADEIWVQFQNFRTSTEEKTAI